jgi:hypothetical protein
MVLYCQYGLSWHQRIKKHSKFYYKFSVKQIIALQWVLESENHKKIEFDQFSMEDWDNKRDG